MVYLKSHTLSFLKVYNADNVTLNNNASITFFLTDVNDNGPYFTVTANDTCVYENTAPGLLVCELISLALHYILLIRLVHMMLKMPI